MVVSKIGIITLLRLASAASPIDLAGIGGGGSVPNNEGDEHRHLQVNAQRLLAKPPKSPTTSKPTSKPTFAPSTPPTSNPTSKPTFAPSTPPTSKPTSKPTFAPSTAKPTAAALTCPQQHCANDVVVTVPVVDSNAICPGLAATTLATFVYSGDVLIELTGPSDPVNAAAMVITAPHGGSLEPTYIPDRQTSGPFCPPEGCKDDKDSYTLEMSRLLQSKFIANYCKVPYLVINHLHRKKLDANREVMEAAQNNTLAMDAWFMFHNFTNVAQSALKSRFGTVDVTNAINATIKGVNALLFDMHGYAGLDWVPVDAAARSDRATHARWMPDHSYECLVRGPGSLASRVTALVDALEGGLTTDALCGHGTPSYEFESPWTLANNPNHCASIPCYYFSGGYDLEVHERMNWQNIPLSGDHFNAVQAELPRCIRFGGDVVRAKFANELSVAVMSFLGDLYD
ncbi:hypothetical protein ACHAW5_008822 [Stephanodiscus triporus]|uniref:Uncharacterized protein n=1 Tax=Stephanodiscus triporus TaxID=2934178 RepID=A0ABD3N2X9_9STRA